jgi:tripartite-type tricarboxylate transporter receptor subunit TctC
MLLTVSLLYGCLPSNASNYPDHELKFVVPNGIGSTNDSTMRALLPGLKQALNANVIPENNVAMKGGAAFAKVANTKDFGYNLYLNSQTVLLLPYAGMPDCKIERLVPVAQVVEDSAIIFVRADSPWADFYALVDDLKSPGGKFKIADNGVGNLWHIAGQLLSRAIGIEFEYVSYPISSRQMLNSLVNGGVDISINGPAESRALLQDKTIRALAIMSDQRLQSMPNVPTCKELGYDVSFPIWRGVFTTAGTDEKKLRTLSDAIKYALETDEFISFSENGQPIKFRGYKDFGGK